MDDLILEMDLSNYTHDHKIHIPIEECSEPLEILSDEFLLEPMYFKWGHSKTPEIKLRSGVIKRLREAQIILQKTEGCEGWKFKIWDGYRTLEVQKILYDEYYERLKKENADWPHDKLCKAVEIFVSPPSHNPKYPAPHNTGAAIDLTIVGSSGNEINMGTPFDEFTERAFTNHFANKPEFIEIHKNRMLFKHIMEKAGFENYFEEWWHYSFGDQEWAKTGKHDKAIYGSMEL